MDSVVGEDQTLPFDINLRWSGLFFLNFCQSLSGSVSMLAWRETFKLSTTVVFLFCLFNIRISKCLLVITSTKIWANVSLLWICSYCCTLNRYTFILSVLVTAYIVGEYVFYSVFPQKLCIDAFVIILTVIVHSWQLLFLTVSGSVLIN